MELGARRAGDAVVLQVAYSEFFDHAHYSLATGREFGSVRDAARDFCERGWRDGVNPSRLFDIQRYLRLYDDVRSAGLNPLEHYLELGLREGRSPRVGPGRLAERPSAPSESDWRALSPIAPSGAEIGVDVVVPVYRGYDDTLACLHAVLTARNDTPFELTVINDSSPEPELTLHLRVLAEQGLFTLVEHERNLGFVRSANEAFSLHPERDVVLLNADTVVYEGWLDRLAWHARQPQVGTVTPLSNNATICSYPSTLENNNCELEVGHSDIDRICAEVNRQQNVDVPTGVGFCFYVRRELLRKIGGFDADSFGIGYGEENDFCMRAAKAGLRNLAALDVYVRHTGEVSFSAAAAAQRSRGMAKLTSLHPAYMRAVDAFVAADPLRPARSAIDLARLGRASAGRGVLFVDHGWVGGIERHLRELTGALAEEGVVVTRLAPIEEGRRLSLSVLSALDLPNLSGVKAGDVEALTRLFRALRLDFVHIHSMVEHRLETFAALTQAIAAAELRYRLTVHDYTPICPRITMVDWGGSYCASPSTHHCRTCISKAGTEFGPVDIDAWRAAYGAIVAGAETVIVPDADVAVRLKGYLDAPPLMLVRPHELWRALPTPRRAQSPTSRTKTIGVIGAIGPHKGSGVLLSLAGDISARRLPLQIKLYGHTDRVELDQFDCVTITGRYREEDIDALITADPCDFVLLPSVWPETYSYTLDITLRLGLHPVCFDLGAAAARLRRLAIGDLLPLSLIYDIEALSDALMMISPRPYAVEALGPQAWWGSRARYYAEGIEAPALLEAAE